MKKCKYALVFILTAALIALGALLPTIAAKVQDAAVQGKISYDTMKEMHLNLYELSTLGKLYLIDRGSIIEISEKEARLSSEDMWQTVENALQPYMQSGFMEDSLEDFSLTCIPRLFYSVQSQEISNIFWLVTLFSAGDNWKRVELVIDDKTGEIMTISYDCQKPIYDDFSINERLEAFYKIYFSRLELYPAEGWHREIGGVKTTTFNWGDVEYGETALEFSVYTNGFYNRAFLSDAIMMENAG